MSLLCCVSAALPVSLFTKTPRQLLSATALRGAPSTMPPDEPRYSALSFTVYCKLYNSSKKRVQRVARIEFRGTKPVGGRFGPLRGVRAVPSQRHRLRTLPLPLPSPAGAPAEWRGLSRQRYLGQWLAAQGHRVR